MLCGTILCRLEDAEAAHVNLLISLPLDLDNNGSVTTHATVQKPIQFCYVDVVPLGSSWRQIIKESKHCLHM